MNNCYLHVLLDSAPTVDLVEQGCAKLLSIYKVIYKDFKVYIWNYENLGNLRHA